MKERRWIAAFAAEGVLCAGADAAAERKRGGGRRTDGVPVCADRCGTAGAVADGRSTERTGDHALCGSLTASGGLPCSLSQTEAGWRGRAFSYERYALRYALGGGQPGMAGAAVVCRENVLDCRCSAGFFMQK